MFRPAEDNNQGIYCIFSSDFFRVLNIFLYLLNINRLFQQLNYLYLKVLKTQIRIYKYAQLFNLRVL
jgi:hypothetical protein